MEHYLSPCEAMPSFTLLAAVKVWWNPELIITLKKSLLGFRFLFYTFPAWCIGLNDSVSYSSHLSTENVTQLAGVGNESEPF